MSETKVEGESSFFGPRFEVGQEVKYQGEKDRPETVELFRESYGLKLGDKYVVKGQKINVISGTLSPGGPGEDESYQEIRLEGVEEKERDPRHPFFPSTWFTPVVEEQVVQQK